MGVLEVKDRVQKMLVELVGSVGVDADGDFGFTFESAKVFVSVRELNEHVVVRVFSQFLREVPVTPDLYRWVATEGQNFFFGHVVMWPGDDGLARLDFETFIVGDYLDIEELRVALGAVANGANDLDDDAQAKFGGKRFFD